MTKLSQDRFSLPPENDLVLNYNPKFLGQGGEHLVYEMSHKDGRPTSLVAKANKYILVEFIQYCRRNNLPFSGFNPTGNKHINNYLNKESSRFHTLQDHFGTEHVLSQRKYFMKVPLTLEIAQEIVSRTQLPVNPEDLPPAFWTVVTFQRRSDVIGTERARSLATGYAEKQMSNTSHEVVDRYNALNNSLLFGLGEVNIPDFRSIQCNQAINDLLDLAKNDAELKSILTEIITSAIRYSNETREILDLAGEGNLIIFRNEKGEWEFQLPDALYPGSVSGGNDLILTSRYIVEMFLRGEEVDEGFANVLLNTFNYIRTINGIAKLLGINDRISIFDGDAATGVKDASFFELLQNS